MTQVQYIDREKASTLLRDWRQKLSISKDEAARKLGIDKIQYEAYEDGQSNMPLPLWSKCRMIQKSPFGEIFFDAPRERWVKAVDMSRRFVSGENVIGEMISKGMWQELRDFMDLARLGPDPDLALTDPSLFMTLREAGTRAYLSGLMHFKGPVEPFDRYKLPRQRDDQTAKLQMPKF